MKLPASLFCMLFVLVVQRAGAQQWDWAQRFQGDRSSGSAIGLDGSGNMYVAGSFIGTNQIGTNQLVSAGSNDVFIAKLDSEGGVVWAISTGGPDDDWIRRLLVTTNGAVFVCGHFSIHRSLLARNDPESVSNAFIARVDDGKFSWFETFSEQADGQVGGVAFGPDESLWLLAATNNRVFVRKYAQDGPVPGGYTVGEDFFWPDGIAVAADGHVFIHGVAGDDVNLGTTNLTGYWTHFAAALDATGRVEWAWNPGRDYYGPRINAIACTPDGGLVSAGSEYSGLPEQWGVVTKHSVGGAVLWQKALGRFFKNFYNVRGVAIGSRGEIILTGDAFDNPYHLLNRRSVWIAVLGPNGDLLSQQFIKSYARADQNIGTAIAANTEGDIFVTGELMGVPTFGTNVMGAGPSGVTNAFVARRPTVLPLLGIQRGRTNVVLDWPQTALPFALQQTEAVPFGAWSDVSSVPEESTGRKRVILAAEQANGFFRLRSTNEIPIRHLPEIYGPTLQRYAFLRRPSTVVTATNAVSLLSFTALARDADQDSLTFQWLDADTGQSLTNGISVAPSEDDDGYRRYFLSLYDTNLVFELGTHTISVVAFDWVFHATNSVTVEVLSVQAAIDELIEAVKAASTNPDDGLLEPLRSAREDAEDGRWDDAANYLREFQTRLADNPELSDANKKLFEDAADTILGAIQRD
jgi:hypothetical protein